MNEINNNLNYTEMSKKIEKELKLKRKIKVRKICLPIVGVFSVLFILATSFSAKNYYEYKRLENIYDGEVKITGSFSFSYNGISKWYSKTDFINNWNFNWFWVGTKSYNRHEFAKAFFEYYYVGYYLDASLIDAVESLTPTQYSTFLSSLRSSTGFPYNISKEEYLSVLRDEKDLKYIDAEQDYFIAYIVLLVTTLISIIAGVVELYFYNKKLKKLNLKNDEKENTI